MMPGCECQVEEGYRLEGAEDCGGRAETGDTGSGRSEKVLWRE